MGTELAHESTLDSTADLAALSAGAFARATSANGRPSRQLLSVVIPAYNEQENVPQMYARLSQALEELGIEWEVIFSVDPCTDRTEELIVGLCHEDARVKMLRFSRRFGQPMATIAGWRRRAATQWSSSTAISRIRRS